MVKLEQISTKSLLLKKCRGLIFLPFFTSDMGSGRAEQKLGENTKW